MSEPTYLPIGRYLGIEGDDAVVLLSEDRMRLFDVESAPVLEYVAVPRARAALESFLASQQPALTIAEVVEAGAVVEADVNDPTGLGAMRLAATSTYAGTLPRHPDGLLVTAGDGSFLVTGAMARALASREPETISELLGPHGFGPDPTFLPQLLQVIERKLAFLSPRTPA